MHNILNIKPITERSDWDSFLDAAHPHTFLHSWNWGELNKKRGDIVWRFGMFEGDALCGVALVIKINARRGSFLFCPHGPLTQLSASSLQLSAILHTLRDFLIQLGTKERVSFIRISPLMENSEENQKLFRGLGFRAAPTHMHPERAWILDVSKSEDEILRGMRKQTRHCIRNAQNAGIEIRASNDPRDVELFYLLHRDTVRRHEFIPFSKEYMQDEFSLFEKDGNALMFLGMYKNEPISGALILFSHGSAFYHHGASSRAHKKIPASHLLQWEIIKETKRRGCALYNFWGIAPEDAKNHPWAGLTLFKKGFGGLSEDYLSAQDFIINKRYWISCIIEKARKWRRGL